jgi:DNA polymerase-3 subunit delta'
VSPVTTDPLDSLRRRFEEGCLHHGILLQGRTIQQCEDGALNLAKFFLSMMDDQMEHPDLFHLRPSGKARIISVEKTRELISTLNRTSNQGGSKIAIIHEADRMKKEAANAFLKTLEEPPPSTFLLLLTARPYALLATIRSRCLITRLPILQSEKVDPQWENWSERYHQWIVGLLDRESLKRDRISPLFTAYGLATSLLGLINDQSNLLVKEVKSSSQGIEDKELDAIEVGVRKGVRSKILSQLAETTRSVVTQNTYKNKLPQLGVKLSRVLKCLEKNVRLMEVNLKDEAAIEDFYLSSLRIWTSK